MEVITAQTAGFCFGVKRAVDTVHTELNKNTEVPIYTFGPIIHNEQVVEELGKRGVKVLNSVEDAAKALGLDNLKDAIEATGATGIT